MMAEEKKNVEDKRYAILSRDSIKAYAESSGHADISEDVASILAEDVVYRLRELAQGSYQFMRHSRRRKLTCSDMNKALQNCDIATINGHGSQDPQTFRRTKEGDLHFVEDLDINLPNIACSGHIPTQNGKCTVKAQWLAVEGQQKGGILTQTLQSAGKPVSKGPKAVPDEYISYYDNITKAILGTDKELIKLALVDLRTNTKLTPILSHLVNFIHSGVRMTSCDTGQLSKLLGVVESIISNKAFFLEPKIYLDSLVDSILYCTVEPLSAPIDPIADHWVLRDRAARLLAKLTNIWGTDENRLRDRNIDALQEILYDPGRPYCAHYGAIMALLTFGTQAVEDALLPHLATYWPALLATLEDNSQYSPAMKWDAQKVHGAILLAAEYVILARRTPLLQEKHSQETSNSSPSTEQNNQPEKPKESGDKKKDPPATTPSKPEKKFTDGDLVGTVLQLPESTNPCKIMLDMYQEYYDYFGDALSTKLPVVCQHDYYVPKKDSNYVSLTDDDSKKSGDALLQQFLDVPHTDRRTSLQNGVGLELDAMRGLRTDRSQSEDLPYKDNYLTVKTTLNDNSKGIKLTIAKRHKGKERSPMDKKKNESRKRKRKDSLSYRLSDYFDRVPPLLLRKSIQFRFPGHKNTSKLKKRQSGGTLVDSKSHYRNLVKQLKPFGKRKAPKGHVKRKTNSNSVYSSSLYCMM